MIDTELKEQTTNPFLIVNKARKKMGKEASARGEAKQRSQKKPLERGTKRMNNNNINKERVYYFSSIRSTLGDLGTSWKALRPLGILNAFCFNLPLRSLIRISLTNKNKTLCERSGQNGG